ncbi:hypothetical protein [Effusibacillus lacus]|uniref:hypothetical protein n=1 Tax=Effusibacillus lacus TaxID=1348429 RepID=UPI0010CF9276|nr:hypothetical protein [Effusibacillus lacus]TCS70976.1 hypothetical protein EDD64_12953 [Effusibacillus lacus]
MTPLDGQAVPPINVRSNGASLRATVVFTAPGKYHGVAKAITKKGKTVATVDFDVYVPSHLVGKPLQVPPDEESLHVRKVSSRVAAGLSRSVIAPTKTTANRSANLPSPFFGGYLRRFSRCPIWTSIKSKALQNLFWYFFVAKPIIFLPPLINGSQIVNRPVEIAWHCIHSIGCGVIKKV